MASLLKETLVGGPVVTGVERVPIANNEYVDVTDEIAPHTLEEYRCLEAMVNLSADRMRIVNLVNPDNVDPIPVAEFADTSVTKLHDILRPKNLDRCRFVMEEAMKMVNDRAYVLVIQHSKLVLSQFVAVYGPRSRVQDRTCTWILKRLSSLFQYVQKGIPDYHTYMAFVRCIPMLYEQFCDEEYKQTERYRIAKENLDRVSIGFECGVNSAPVLFGEGIRMSGKRKMDQLIDMLTPYTANAYEHLRGIKRLGSKSYHAWVRELFREGIEMNPGPIQMKDKGCILDAVQRWCFINDCIDMIDNASVVYISSFDEDIRTFFSNVRTKPEECDASLVDLMEEIANLTLRLDDGEEAIVYEGCSYPIRNKLLDSNCLPYVKESLQIIILQLIAFAKPDIEEWTQIFPVFDVPVRLFAQMMKFTGGDKVLKGVENAAHTLKSVRMKLLIKLMSLKLNFKMLEVS